MSIQVRQALDSDRQAVSGIIMAAFGERQGSEIVRLVLDLAEDQTAQPSLSLVAVADDRVIGHILFTKAGIKGIKDCLHHVRAAILAPLAVHPEYQNQGLGGLLIKEGLRRLKADGVELVFVLGHPDYYPKYGFSEAGVKGLEASYPIAPENSGAWMVQELYPGFVGSVRGQVICAKALDDPRHWQE